MPSPGPSSAAPATIRPRVRDAVRRAWAPPSGRARCPHSTTGPGAPAVEVERPANAAFGDQATNLALKLARPLRRSPLDIAEALADAIGTGPTPPDRHGRGRPPRLPQPAGRRRGLRAPSPGSSPRPASGAGPARQPRAVNVEFVSANPTGPLHGRQRARRVRRRPPLPRSRGGRPAGHPRVLLQRLGGAGPQPRRLRPGDPRGRADPGGRLPRRVRRRARAGAAGRGRGRRGRAGADGADVVGRWASDRIRTGIEASLAALGVRFDVWKIRGLASRRRLGRSRDRAPARRRPPLRARRRDVVPLDRRSATTRTGS